MKLRIVMALALFSWTILAHAEVLDFESPVLSSCGDWGVSPTGWTIEGGTAAVSDDVACSYINFDGAYSGKQYMVNFNSMVGALTRNAGAFDLNGAYVHADDREGETTVDFAGYDDSDTLLYSATRVVGSDWQWVELDWPGITTFTWDSITPGVSNITIDDVTFNNGASIDREINTEPVPSLNMYGLILAILGFLLIAVHRLFATSRRV